MRVNVITDTQKINNASSAGDAAIMNAADGLMEQLGCSPLTALTLLFQCSIQGLMAVGGPRYSDYVHGVTEAFKEEGYSDDLLKRQKVAFEDMAAFADLLVTNPEGSA
ncbi:MAG: hypothetical protein JKX76_00480 [Colwellia sp.]|nr:hypothetical protein [Colwellia sp.]